MSKKVSAAHAKAHLADLVSRVAYGGERYVIERRGTPVAALVGMDDLRKLEPAPAEPTSEPRDFLGLIGAWGDILTDEEIDEMVAHIYAEREKSMPRPFSFPDDILDDVSEGPTEESR